ncbi:SDR family oxidoreductase [Kordiimonas marina]|uniref:SDR family oxidoreductase n=1 Tax=Kordiimonas marina TaxID=2872312 RepID=UPI0031BAEDA1|nr:SDR family oxidoreductase [Kordiimonas marina]
MTAPPKSVLVTGSSRGIGAATACLAAARGYDVCINYSRDAAAAEAVVQTCRQYGVRAMAIQADIADETQVVRMFELADEAFGPLGHLVNNAGILGTACRLEAAEGSMIGRVMAVNVVGAMLCAREAVRRMSVRRSGLGGSIVNVSSIAATLGSPGEYVHYAASKAALDTFTVGLAKEVGPEGIRVNSVQAGTVATTIHEASGNPDRPAMVAATAPLRKVGEPANIAEAVLWLMSDAASYATGAVLRVGGGL